MSPEARETFPKSARLRKRSEFLKLSRSGKKVHSPNFVVIYDSNGRGASRLGITVSGKVGNAVVRNHVKRLVREFFRHRREELPQDLDVLVIAKKSATDVSLAQIERELGKSFGYWRIHPDRNG